MRQMDSAEFFESDEFAVLQTYLPAECDLARDLLEHLAVQQEPNYSRFFAGAVDDLVNNGRAVLAQYYAHRGIERVVAL